jgi:hypothetical protein
MPDYTSFSKVFKSMPGGASTPGGALPPIPKEPASIKAAKAPPPPPPKPKAKPELRRQDYALPTDMVPPVEGMARLYRAHNDAPKAEMPSWVKAGLKDTGADDASGRWFTDDPATLGFYLEDQGPTGKPYYIDVPKSEYEQYRVKNYVPDPNSKVDPRKFSRDQQTEFFVPPEWANSKQPIR